jgi:hypothetical protein
LDPALTRIDDTALDQDRAAGVVDDREQERVVDVEHWRFRGRAARCLNSAEPLALYASVSARSSFWATPGAGDSRAKAMPVTTAKPPRRLIKRMDFPPVSPSPGARMARNLAAAIASKSWIDRESGAPPSAGHPAMAVGAPARSPQPQ